MGKKVQLVGDKLTIDSKLFTVNNLGELSPDLSPEKLATKTVNDHTFFSAASTLSNFHTSKFKVEGVDYSHGEMFIQTSKAKLFNDEETYKNIMAS